jgi:hypothetical protein
MAKLQEGLWPANPQAVASELRVEGSHFRWSSVSPAFFFIVREILRNCRRMIWHGADLGSAREDEEIRYKEDAG